MRVEVDGLRELRRDLKMVDRTLPRQLNKDLKRTAEPVRAEAARLAPKRTGRLAASIKVGTSGSRVRIYSRRPGAALIHYGGRHPVFGNRNVWVQQPANPFIQKAASRHARQFEQDVAHAVESLMRRAGFH